MRAFRVAFSKARLGLSTYRSGVQQGESLVPSYTRGRVCLSLSLSPCEHVLLARPPN